MWDLWTTPTVYTCPIACGLVIGFGGSWLWTQIRRRSRPTPLEDLKASIHDRRESLRKAAATEYRPRK